MKWTLIIGLTSILASSCLAQRNGLQVRTLDGPTDCRRKVQSGDNIVVHYHGTLTDGKVFDSSYERNQPFNVQIGVGKVIKGWDQGIVGMCPGEKRQLVIPPELGYGQRGAGDDIPGGATLVFQVEMIAFQNPEPADLVPQTQQSGLQIQTLGGPTSCSRKVQSGDNIVVHYHGTLTDGKVFDSSYERNQPFNVQIGVGKVIKGWDQGIVGMCPGEKRQLVIPPELGYGSRGAGDAIPGGATLVFQVEMIAFQNPEPAAAVPQPQQSGLQIRTVGGPTSCGRNKVQAGDKIIVHYHGTLTDGTVFDSSYERNQPFNVQIGVGKVIQGWDQGIVGMCPGEKRQLIIPPELGYGQAGAGDAIPGGATLVFQVEMIAFQ